MPSLDVLLLRLVLVVLIGGIIGAEREYKNKSAGFRTMILICIGSFLFTTFSFLFPGITSDRIAANIVTGIGFLGAGVIFRSGFTISGITTAATIWANAALSMGIALGHYEIVAAAAVIVLGALSLFTRLEKLIDKRSLVRNYNLVLPNDIQVLHEYEEMLHQYNLKFLRLGMEKNNDDLATTWKVTGATPNHEKWIERIMKDETVRKFKF